MTAYEVVAHSKWFRLSEFTTPSGESFADDLRQVQPALIYELEQLRREYGHPIHPSRDRGGLIRTSIEDRGSRHYAGDGRLGNAIDIFPEGDPSAFLVAAIMRMAFRGIGVYGDTRISKLQPGPMFHLDMRPGEISMWVRLNGEYIYRNHDPTLYYKALAEALKHGHSKVD